VLNIASLINLKATSCDNKIYTYKLVYLAKDLYIILIIYSVNKVIIASRLRRVIDYFNIINKSKDNKVRLYIDI